MSSFLDLPPEVTLMVASYLSVPEKQLLRLTCSHFRDRLPSLDTLSFKELLAIEASPYNAHGYMACRKCVKLYDDICDNRSKRNPWLCIACNKAEKEEQEEWRACRNMWKGAERERASSFFTSDQNRSLKVMPNTTLIDLPMELKLMVASYLSVPERQLLRMTCSRFRYMLPSTATLSFKDLLAIEASPYNANGYLACSKCMVLYDNEGASRRKRDPWLCRACYRADKKERNELWAWRQMMGSGRQRAYLRMMRKRQGLGRGWFEAPTTKKRRMMDRFRLVRL